jgi:predicted GNAT family acetyltransferase
MADAHKVMHLPAEGRVEARLDGGRGELRYVRREVEGRSVMVIPSVVVDRAIEGRGVAGALTRAALEWAGAEGLRVERARLGFRWRGRSRRGGRGASGERNDEEGKEQPAGHAGESR